MGSDGEEESWIVVFELSLAVTAGRPRVLFVYECLNCSFCRPTGQQMKIYIYKHCNDLLYLDLLYF